MQRCSVCDAVIDENGGCRCTIRKSGPEYDAARAELDRIMSEWWTARSNG